MHDQPVGRTSEPAAGGRAEARQTQGNAARTRAGVDGLSARLFALTVLFVTLTEVFIYVPSIASFRLGWLADRLTVADAASLVLAESTAAEIPREAQDGLLSAVGAIAIAVRTGEVSQLIASVELPPAIDDVADLRNANIFGAIGPAFQTLLSGEPRILRVIGVSRTGNEIEMVMSDRALREAMLRYSVNVLLISLLVSVVTAALLYFTLNRLLVRPMRRLTDNMVAFSAAPDDTSRIIEPSGRRDEIGTAEEHLAAMQQALQTTLREQRHLADLGLAVSKINHDLRNMLASAQLFSDRLGSLPDPNVQRFAPKLIAALDRAISYCQMTLAYGRAREAAPSRRLVNLWRVVEDVAETQGLDGHPTITFDNRVPADLEVDADPEQLFRVLLNLTRNAMQALDGDADPAIVRRIEITGARDNGAVTIRVSDTGPGVPERARAHLFHAFQGAVRPGGTGLGLAIAAELVRAHGGSIALDDAARAGAMFVIAIPDRRGRVVDGRGERT